MNVVNMARNEMGLTLGTTYMFRSAEYSDMEKRQLFLRSYQFSRKKSMAERIKGSLFRVKRVICFRLKSAKKIRRLLWFRIRHGLFYNYRRRKFFRRLYTAGHGGYRSSSSSCFW